MTENFTKMSLSQLDEFESKLSKEIKEEYEKESSTDSKIIKLATKIHGMHFCITNQIREDINYQTKQILWLLILIIALLATILYKVW